jgi:hypothetical protein
MKTILLFIAFLALIWIPVLCKVYGWREGLILTISISIASYLIDKLILEKKRKKGSE